MTPEGAHFYYIGIVNIVEKKFPKYRFTIDMSQ